MTQITDFNGFMFDIDGVILKGDTVIDGAKDCIEALQRNGKQYIFVTNHTKHTKRAFIEKLRSFDIPVRDDQLITASNATVDYLESQTTGQQKPKVYLIGEGGIVADFQEAGFELTDTGADFVVIAWDSKFDYEKIYTACKNIREGAGFIITSPDRYIPSERGFEPGFGTLGAAIAYATQVEPVYVGKPYPPMIATACRMMGTTLEDSLIVGDTAETDLHARTLAGLSASIAVLSGNLNKTDVEQLPNHQKPTFVLDSVKDLAQLFS